MKPTKRFLLIFSVYSLTVWAGCTSPTPDEEQPKDREVPTFTQAEFLPPGSLDEFLERKSEFPRAYGQSLEIEMSRIPPVFLRRNGGRLDLPTVEAFLLAQLGERKLNAEAVAQHPQNGRAVESPSFPLHRDGSGQFSIHVAMIDKPGETRTHNGLYGSPATPGRIALETTLIIHDDGPMRAETSTTPLDQTSWARSDGEVISRQSSGIWYAESVPSDVIDYVEAWHRGLVAAIELQTTNAD